MNYKSILRIAQELEESGYSNYAKDIKFNDQGTLELESIRAIVNSFEQELTNADMS